MVALGKAPPRSGTHGVKAEATGDGAPRTLGVVPAAAPFFFLGGASALVTRFLTSAIV